MHQKFYKMKNYDKIYRELLHAGSKKLNGISFLHTDQSYGGIYLMSQTL